MMRPATTALAAALLTACGPTSTIVRPTEPLPPGALQVRLHQTAGEGIIGIEGASLTVAGSTAKQGTAHGCTYTRLGDTLPGERIVLRAGSCTAIIRSYTAHEIEH